MKRRTIPLALVALVAACFLALPALSQEDMTTIPDQGFAKHTRLPAVFNHDAHNEKAGITDCVVCHHGGKDGVLDKNASSEGTPCSECHTVRGGPGVTPLARAWHRQCMGCHRAVGKGPLACGDCHKPS